jgi:hypothetical protein
MKPQRQSSTKWSALSLWALPALLECRGLGVPAKPRVSTGCGRPVGLSRATVEAWTCPLTAPCPYPQLQACHDARLYNERHQNSDVMVSHQVTSTPPQQFSTVIQTMWSSLWTGWYLKRASQTQPYPLGLHIQYPSHLLPPLSLSDCELLRPGLALCMKSTCILHNADGWG